MAKDKTYLPQMSMNWEDEALSVAGMEKWERNEKGCSCVKASRHSDLPSETCQAFRTRLCLSNITSHFFYKLSY